MIRRGLVEHRFSAVVGDEMQCIGVLSVDESLHMINLLLEDFLGVKFCECERVI
jgi:hypothetical protein